MRTLREHRETAGLTVRALAEKADVSTRTIVQAESARQDPYPATMRRIASALGVSVLDISEFAVTVEGKDTTAEAEPDDTEGSFDSGVAHDPDVRSSLTDGDQSQLDEVVRILEGLPTPEVLREIAANDLRQANFSLKRDLADETEGNELKRRYRRSYSAVIAAEKVLEYAVSLRDAEMRRREMSVRIRQAINAYPAVRRSRDIDQIVRLRTHIDGLVAQQQLALHYITIAITKIHELLGLVTSAAGVKWDTQDERFLGSFRPLRNYFEHPENHMPGRPLAHRAVREKEDESGWTIEFGLEINGKGEVMMEGKAIEVTAAGYERVRYIIAKMWEEVKPRAIERFKTRCQVNPGLIPNPDAIDTETISASKHILGELY